jgi:nitrate reductase (NAD(P)H)
MQSKQSQYELDDDNKESTNKISFPLPIETKKPTEILECDIKTADNHVPRDSRLIRLTGIHPFNCEAPLTDLYNSGFITPTELWFVRNHGSVPKILDDDINNWTFIIEGLVENPMTIQLNELFKFPQVTVPITLVCAGNRRKEENIVRKGKGFNWGSAGVSTALFTGVFMYEILKIVKPKFEGKYMCMEGADELPNGNYGTSIRLSIAMNPIMKVMLAYKMNGELLTPDHGRPLRVVIPGQIGGRSVKWLKKIIITNKPSNNWYHIYDNRVLPTMLTPEIVDKDKYWWIDERYALYNLNVQSVICYPAHDEIIKIEDNKIYNIKGFAYNGGGIRIGRVEISLDQGLTWKLTDINYPEDLYKEILDSPEIFGGILDMKNDEQYFCWCFWNINITIEELSQAKDIIVRAMDEYMNIQPRDMYWSVLSMLNNCWHRLTIDKEENNTILKFNHPTLPGINQGGWMEKVKDQGGNLTDGFWGSSMIMKEKSSTINVKMINDSITRIISEEELSKHNKDGDTWFAVNGHVYDASDYLKEHPGGSDSIILASGEDASEDFLAIHSDIAKSMLSKYHIGILETINTKTNNFINEIDREFFLNTKQWSKTILKTKTKLNHDTYHLIFELEHPNQKLGVPIGKHLYLQCISSSGEKVIRSYTPISHIDQLGQFELIIKIYKSYQNQSIGKMSDCIDRLQQGDFVQCKGPFGDFEYKRNKIILHKGISRKVEKLTMIAGGSGITPIYQVFRYAYKDGVECDIIYCNKTEDDILLRNELESLQEIRHCLSHSNKNWKGYCGHISKDIMGQQHHGLLLCCGPPQMEKLVRNIAEKIGWDMDNQFILF